MPYITWPRGVICHSFGSLLILSCLSLHLPLFTSPSLHFCLFASFSPSFLHFSPSNRSHYCFNGSALPLCYLPKSLATKHLGGGAFQGPGKGCLKQREQDLREQRTGKCKKGYRQERPGVHPLTQAESSPPAAADRIIYSTSIWNGQSKKKYIS